MAARFFVDENDLGLGRTRGFVLTGTASQSTADSLSLLEWHWSEIEEIVVAEPDGPWMRAVTRAGIRLLSLS